MSVARGEFVSLFELEEEFVPLSADDGSSIGRSLFTSHGMYPPPYPGTVEESDVNSPSNSTSPPPPEETSFDGSDPENSGTPASDPPAEDNTAPSELIIYHAILH